MTDYGMSGSTALDDRRLDVETPEQVAVGFDLAGPGSRFAAFLLDMVILIGLILGVGLGTALLGLAVGAGSSPLRAVLGSMYLAFVLIVVFVLLYGYFVYFEGLRNGQTPGKKYFDLRVVQDGGYPVTLREAAIRNLIRLIDLQPFPTGLLGGAFILLHGKSQRLGDMAAGTVVVRERQVRLELEEHPEATGSPRLTDEQYDVIREYVLRRGTLEPEARQRIATKLARLFRSYDDQGTGADDALLIRVYNEESARRTASGARVGTGSAAATALVRRQKTRWRKYGILLGRAQSDGLAGVAEDEVSEFAALYREIAADLARARTYGGSPELLYTLEHSVGAGHNLLYAPARRSGRRALRWLVVGFPALVRERAAIIGIAAIVFFGPGIIAGTAVALEPARARQLVPAEMIARAEEGARRQAAGQGYIDMPPTAMPLMSSGIIANNVQVSFFAFAGGILAGFGTLLILLLNGIHLGSVFGLFHTEGLGLYLWTFVLPHGLIELTAITIAGGAGLWLGSAFLLPGRLTRSQALVERGRDAISLVAGVVAMLLVAGLIEGFISPGPLPAVVKLAFGAATGVLLLAYFTLSGRNDPGPASDIRADPAA